MLVFEEKIKTNRKLFVEKVKEIALDLSIDPNWLMIVMNNESGINHLATNSIGCVGLIQFCEPSRKQLGVSKEELLSMSNVRQLDYVQAYFESLLTWANYFSGFESFADLYLAAFLPAYVGKPDSTTFSQSIVSANPTLGKSIGEFKQIVVEKYEKYYPYLTKEGNPYFENLYGSNFWRWTTRRKRYLLILSIISVVLGGYYLYTLKYFEFLKKNKNVDSL